MINSRLKKGKEENKIRKEQSFQELTLGQLAQGQEAVILSVPDLSIFPPLGFRPNKRISIQTKGCLGGPIFAQIEERCIALDRQLAEKVKVLCLLTEEKYEVSR